MSKVYVPSNELRSSLQDFLKKHKIVLEFVDNADVAEVVIQKANDHKKESDFKYLIADGEILCSVGRSMANRLHIEKKKMAKVLDFLDVDTIDGELA